MNLAKQKILGDKRYTWQHLPDLMVLLVQSFLLGFPVALVFVGISAILLWADVLNGYQFHWAVIASGIPGGAFGVLFMKRLRSKPKIEKSPPSSSG